MGQSLPKRGLTTDELINQYRAIITDVIPAWVMFSHGTVVVLRDLPESSKKDVIQSHAIKIMEKYGKVYPGSASGDVNVYPGKHPVTQKQSWIVRFWHEDIWVYVDIEDMDQMSEIPNPFPNQSVVGYFGRDIRQMDAEELQIVHTEFG